MVKDTRSGQVQDVRAMLGIKNEMIKNKKLRDVMKDYAINDTIEVSES